jgi:hypothetical protein
VRAGRRVPNRHVVEGVLVGDLLHDGHVHIVQRAGDARPCKRAARLVLSGALSTISIQVRRPTTSARRPSCAASVEAVRQTDGRGSHGGQRVRGLCCARTRMLCACECAQGCA